MLRQLSRPEDTVADAERLRYILRFGVVAFVIE
jgi:hypothetical protein